MAKKARKKAAHSRPDTVKWTAQQMKKNPGASMTDLKKLGSAAGYHVYPLIIGLARKELGWSRPKKKATRKKAQARGGAGADLVARERWTTLRPRSRPSSRA